MSTELRTVTFRCLGVPKSKFIRWLKVHSGLFWILRLRLRIFQKLAQEQKLHQHDKQRLKQLLKNTRHNNHVYRRMIQVMIKIKINLELFSRWPVKFWPSKRTGCGHKIVERGKSTIKASTNFKCNHKQSDNEFQFQEWN